MSVTLPASKAITARPWRPDARISGSFLIPLVLALATAFLVPSLHTLYLSFCDYNPALGIGPNFNYGHNFLTLARDGQFLASLVRSLVFSLSCVAVEMSLGLLISVWMWPRQELAKQLFPIIIIPSLLPPTVVGLLWLYLFNSRFGPITLLLRALGAENAQSPFGLVHLALPTIGLVDAWQWTPFVAILFYSALLSIPRRLVEAARLDGASEWQLFRAVVLPQLGPASAAIAIIRFIDCMKEFDKVYVLTQGGPSNVTETISMYIWRVGFRHWDLGYSAALSLVIYMMTAVAANCMIKVIRRAS